MEAFEKLLPARLKPLLMAVADDKRKDEGK
jgi:hypothetical protein